MRNYSHSLRRLSVLTVALGAATLAMFGAVSGSAATKTSLKGTLLTHTNAGETCSSPVDNCFTGTSTAS